MTAATQLYLDTARMGALCPAAQRASRAVLSLLAAEGCSPCFENFLWEGVRSLPSPHRKRRQALADWQGLAAFKDQLRALVRAPQRLPVLLANRTSHLTRLAARVLFR